MEHKHGFYKHNEEEKKRLVNRISRTTGHLEAIKRMVNSDRDCCEILIQVAAVKSEVNGINTLILNNHINSCIKEALNSGDEHALKALNKALSQVLK